MANPSLPNAFRDTRAERWERQFAKLVAFQQRFGHCRVPKRWREDPGLAIWVSNQRRAFWRDTLPLERIQRLVEVGFDGRGRPYTIASWKDRLNQLAGFKARFGHCNVPSLWAEQPSLGHWVSNQRKLWKKGLLKPEQMHELGKLGFHWQLLTQKHPHFKPPPDSRRELASQLEALNRRWEKRLAAWR